MDCNQKLNIAVKGSKKRRCMNYKIYTIYRNKKIIWWNKLNKKWIRKCTECVPFLFGKGRCLNELRMFYLRCYTILSSNIDFVHRFQMNTSYTAECCV